MPDPIPPNSGYRQSTKGLFEWAFTMKYYTTTTVVYIGLGAALAIFLIIGAVTYWPIW